MERSVGPAAHTRAGLPAWRPPGARWVVGALILSGALAAGPAAAQQDTTRERTPPAAGDTLARDTVPVDSMTLRERALLRLRAMPTDPVQPDTTVADSLAEPADTASEAGVDTLPPGYLPPDTAAERVDPAARPDPAAEQPAVRRVPGLPAGVREVDDTVVLFTGDEPDEDTVLLEDSVRALLLSLEGYSPTGYEGERAVFV
ncbi:MAG: hypothetical protein ACLFRX_07985, partial [Gemmatimonadota bacterium]